MLPQSASEVHVDEQYPPGVGRLPGESRMLLRQQTGAVPAVQSVLAWQEEHNNG